MITNENQNKKNKNYFLTHKSLDVMVFIPPVLGLLGIISMLIISNLLKNKVNLIQSFTAYHTLNIVFTKQVYVFIISLLVLTVMYFYNPRNFKQFFKFGDLLASTEPLKILGIRETDSWKKIGPVIAFLLTGGTGIFMTFGVLEMNGVMNKTVIQLFPLAFIFSTTNAWSEEIFARFTVIAGLNGKVRPVAKYWISAIIFAVPHYFGTPGGPLGVLMAGFLGWLLAKSVHETKGMFWAWFIHFLQDMVIFTANLMILAGHLGS